MEKLEDLGVANAFAETQKLTDGEVNKSTLCPLFSANRQGY